MYIVHMVKGHQNSVYTVNIYLDYQDELQRLLVRSNNCRLSHAHQDHHACTWCTCGHYSRAWFISFNLSQITSVGRIHGNMVHVCVLHTKIMLSFHAVTFDSDSHLTMKALSRLQRVGITSLRELDTHTRPLQSVVGMDKVDLPTDSSFSLLEMWVQGRASLRPTWRHFFWALREIKLNHLADQMESFLSGVAVEQTATSNLDVSLGSKETEGREEDNKQEEGENKLDTSYCS